MDIGAGTLLLDETGTLIQGPDFGKIDLLKRAGAFFMRKAPRSLKTHPSGYQLICIRVVPHSHEAAVWVQDMDMFALCREAHKKEPDNVRWMSIVSEPLYTAERMAATRNPDPGVNGRVGTMMRPI